MKILITGGAGYIGSHTCVELLNAGHEIIVIDNFSNSSTQVIESIKKITHQAFIFYQGDVQDENLLNKIFKEHKIDAVVHFAGFKAVGESVSNPLKYYQNNLLSTITLCQVMAQNNCFQLVFSSSATVYGKPRKLPIKETAPLKTTNPYGTTKLMIEQILGDLCVADERWGITILRYFNPIGAHESGLLGDNPNQPNNLMPYVVKVATHELPILNVFGNDFNTPDGTGVRDYIHVIDLAQGHLQALNKLKSNQGIKIYNLGTGKGYSVLEIIKTFEKVNKVKINYQIVERRAGDIDACYADTSLAKKELSWQAKYDLNKMCQDAYNFVIKNNN
ncbi:MAG TPA: UDP-glucose 4-epimerase GalE [Bacilli bacterium]|nr:UDP-glucose 4-epimerase GalE [Bacilli bacterium]